jgi:hypothetical protein
MPRQFFEVVMLADEKSVRERATAGRSLQADRLFRPSWYYFLEKDPFWLWCYYHAPEVESVDKTTRFDQYDMQLDNYLPKEGTSELRLAMESRKCLRKNAPKNTNRLATHYQTN